MLRRLIGLPRTGVPAAATGGGPDAQPGGTGDGSGQAASPTPDVGDWTTGSAAETATVREIVAQLASMPVDQARYLAGFAYILGRTAQADLHVTDEETRRMEAIVAEHGRIPEVQAVIVVQIARTRAELFGSTEDYLVTREFRRISTDEQRLAVLRCCFLIGAVDGTITAEESSTLTSIADELDVDQAAARALRAEFAETFSALQALRHGRTETTR